MKQWIKLETDLMQDERIQKLIQELGTSGLGLYLAMRLAIESTNERSMLLSRLMVACNPYARQSKIRKVLLEYGLFCIDGNMVLASTPAQTPADKPAQTPADVPLIVPSEHNKEIEKENKNLDTEKNSKESEGAVAGCWVEEDTELAQRRREAREREHQRAEKQLRDLNYMPSKRVLEAVPESMHKYSGELWYPYICWLFDDQGTQRYRETLLMQATNRGFMELVMRHWTAMVEQFVIHLVTWASADSIISLRNVQVMLSRYLRPTKLPGRMLGARLKWLELRDNASDERELRYYDFMQRQCPHLVEMEHTLSYAQFDELRLQYGKDQVLDVLRDMENEGSLNKRNCYETARCWLEARAIRKV